MVIASLALSPIRDRSLQSLPSSKKDELAKLREGVSQLTELVKPLLALSTRNQIDAAMDSIAGEFLHAYNKVWHSLQLSQSELIEFGKQGYCSITDLVKEDTGVLLPAEKELLLDIVQSRLDLLEVLVESSEVEQSRLNDVLVECVPSFERADICLLAITLALGDEVRDWHANSIRLICQVMNEHTLRIENTFISHDKELIERLRTKAEIISLEEVRQELGLSD